ncbi:MAG: hypothetical protein GY950_00080, partial [bacterium]|nr:hypothetical protein [bacterium]
MMEPISVIIGSTLTGLAVNFLSFVSKKSVDGLRELFSEDQLKSVLNRAFSDFKEDYVTAGGTADEEKLLKVFEDFFKDKRAVGEFQMVFAARRDDVDFNLLEEIFVEICITEDIDIPTFNFFRAVSHMVDGIDALAQKEETLRETFQTAHLDKIRSYLGRRGEESNITFARLKYLTQLEMGGTHDKKSWV